MTLEFNDMTPDDDDLSDSAIRARIEELTREFMERHPVKWEANKFVNGLIDAARLPDGVVSTRLDRERARAGAELHVRYNIFSDVFESADIQLESYIFSTLAKIIRAAYELGIHAAPDGRHAREKHSDQCGAKARAVEVAVRIYLEAHPDTRGPPKATTEYANAIRPAILERA